MKAIIVIFIIGVIIFFGLPAVFAAEQESVTKLAQVPTSCDAAYLANFYDVPYPRKDSPATVSLVNCINSKIPNLAMIDTTQIYTYQRNPDLINYTRGNQICGLDTLCESLGCHRVNSCHYGGKTGTQGAEAVDFNAASGYTETALFEEIKKLVYPDGACHGLAKFILYEDDHTHLSTNVDAGCDYANIPEITTLAAVPAPAAEAEGVSLPDALGGDTDIISVILRVIKIALAVVGIFALFMFIYGGFQFLMSAGNPETVKKAKSTLIWAVIGILVVTLSYSLIKFVFEAITKGTS